MDIVLEQYRTRLTTRNRKPATLALFDTAAARFQKFLDQLGKRAVELEPWEIEEYLTALDLAPTTRNTHWIHLGGALRYAHRRGMISKDPTVDVYLEPVPRGIPQTIPSVDLRAMRGRITCDRQWLLWHLLVYTGMRQGEIRALRWEQVDLAKSALLLEYTKNGDIRYVPLHPLLSEVLAELSLNSERHIITTRGDRPVAYGTFMADLRAFAPGYTAHWFRRTVTSSLLDNGVDERTVKMLLGWMPQTVMGKFYARPNLVVMQRAILKLYADDPI